MSTNCPPLRTSPSLAPRRGVNSPHRGRSGVGRGPRALPQCLVNETVRDRQVDLRAALAGLVGGAAVPAYVRDQIEASWRRSLVAGLTPDTVKIPFDGDYDSDAPLVHAARPVLDQLAADVAGSRVAVLLTDAQGRVVDRRASERGLVAHLDRILLAPGHVYAEDRVGTNGMGTALAQRSAAAVEAEEHFADSLTTVACAGAPITDPRSGRTLGAVDLTCLAGAGSRVMLPLAVRAGRDVEQRMLDDSRVGERLVIQRFLQERRRAKGPVAFLTERTMFTNAAADRIVQPEDEALLRECGQRLSSGESDRVVLSAGAEVVVQSEPIVEGGVRFGAVLRLTPASDRRVRGSATFGWKSLTDTERSVIELVSLGLTNREAAERLFLSHHTVGFHLRSIYRKLDVSSRVDLTRLTLEHEAP